MQFCSMLHKLAFQEYLVLLYLVLCSLHEKKNARCYFWWQKVESFFWKTSDEHLVKLQTLAWVGVISLAPPSVYSQAHKFFFRFFVKQKKLQFILIYSLQKSILFTPETRDTLCSTWLLSKGPFTQCTELHSWMLNFDRGVVLCLFACPIEKNDKERANIVHLKTMSGRKKHVLGEEICC